MNTEDREKVKRDVAKALGYSCGKCGACQVCPAEKVVPIVECQVDAAEKLLLEIRAQQKEDFTRADKAEARLHDLERRVRELGEKVKLDTYGTIHYFYGQELVPQLLSLLTPAQEKVDMSGAPGPQAEAKPPMMVCPKVAKCSLSSCPHYRQHKLNQGCNFHLTETCPACIPTPPEPPKARERVTLHLNAPPVCYTSEWDAIVDYLCDVAPARFKKAGEDCKS